MIFSLIQQQTQSEQDIWLKMERVFDLYYQKLYVYAYAMLCDEDEAKDIVSGVMQTLWEDWKGDTPRMANPTAGMLYTLVRNRCLDILKHEKVKERYEAMIEATGEMADDDDVEEFERRIDDVREAVDRLPENSKRVLMCTYYKKMSYRETAEMLGMSENMVRKHMVKAFRLLREMLKFIILWYQISTFLVI